MSAEVVANPMSSAEGLDRGLVEQIVREVVASNQDSSARIAVSGATRSVPASLTPYNNDGQAIRSDGSSCGVRR